MNPIFGSILLPIIIGTLCLGIPKKVDKLREFLAIITSLVVFGLTIIIFLNKPLVWAWAQKVVLRADSLSAFISLAIGLFGVLISLYSISFMKGKPGLNQYYGYLLWTLGAALGAALANNLILLLVFWGFLGLTLYLLINLGGDQATAVAKKTFIIVGGSDCLMILGIGLIWHLTDTFSMDQINISLSGGLPVLAYLCLAIAAFAKAGAMPFHSWIPDTAEKAPTPVTAYLPASLDKLLGIYLLARISLHLFVMNRPMGTFLMFIGAVTIVAAVMMALIQHDLKRLLGYHAVSQVGYMVLGIGTGNPVGIAGGLFHMVNHAIYKSCLFLSGGSVEHRTKTCDLEKLGGLAKQMPITFITCLIAALSISGIPPFNGFVSKWMVYQGCIEVGKTGDRLWIIWLAAAMFGSALTLASFVKLIHATFLGQPSEKIKEIFGKIKEVNFAMVLPMVTLAGLCVIFGVFAYQVPLKFFIHPSIGEIPTFPGFWSPSLATWLIIIGIVMGLLIYLLGNIKGVREDTSYIGGEVTEPRMTVSGVDFYQTISEMGLLKGIYRKAEAKVFDIYDQGRRLTFFITNRFRHLHSGLLPAYLVWCLVGMLVLFFILVR